MAKSSSCFNLEEAMDKIWFHNNILFSQSNFKILSMLQKDENILKSAISSEDNRSYELLQPVVCKNKKKKIVQKMKKLGRLHFPANSISSEEKIPQRTVRRSHWSVYELENYQLKWFSDLGFVFRKEEFNGRRNQFEEGKGEEERRPYLSEAWFINRADSPLLNLRRLPKTVEGTDMKR